MSLPRSDISWTDYSGGACNVVIGCTKVSTGCLHCYAETWAHGYQWQGGDFTRVRTYPEKLRELRRATFDAGERPYRRGSGSRPLAFLVDLGDLFHEAVSDAFVLDVLDMCADRADVDWQLLTKRPERMVSLLAGQRWPANVWLGVTCENQDAADERIPLLGMVDAGVRFVSAEPLLERVTLPLDGINWVIVGGESGPVHRSMDLEWARDLRAQCRAAGVAYFFKQSGGRYPGEDDLLDGERMQEWPAPRGFGAEVVDLFGGVR